MLPDDPDLQARLFYLAILGMAVAVWAFSHYRGRLGQAMQHAAIWALIFIGTILAVGFYEPMKQQLFHDKARTVDATTVVFDRARDGHFYATLDVNGTDVMFMIDTGATGVVLSKRDAARIGFDPDTLRYTITANTANGQVQSAPVTLDEVSLGPFNDADVKAMVNGGALNRSLLGMSYLKRFHGFRVEGDRFYLER